MSCIAILGAGSWGTALAVVLADNGHHVNLWTRHKKQAININMSHKNEKFLDVLLPKQIKAYDQIEKAVKDADTILLAIPTKAVQDVCQQLEPHLKKSVVLVHAIKGIEPDTTKRISEMILETLTDVSFDDIVVIGGPSHAEEVALRQPTTVTVASKNVQHVEFTQNLLMNESFRVYTSSDTIGVELGGALKNIIALGAGISDGLGYGDNAKAALITRGLAEISRLSVSLGANPLTFLGLPGVGDLIVTCTSNHSRNWRAGYLLGKGQQLNEVLNQMGMIVEGVRTTEAAYHLALEHNIDMPIVAGMYRLLYKNQEAKKIVDQLMNRNKREELDTFT